jgi:hypothetical protein
MSNFTRKYCLENYVIGFPTGDYYTIELPYLKENEKDIDKIIEKFYSMFGKYKLIQRFKHDCKIIDDIIEDIKKDYFKKSGSKYIVKQLENGKFEMSVYIRSLEDLDSDVFKKQLLQFTKDIIDVTEGKKLVDNISFTFDLNVEVEVTVNFHIPRYFTPISMFKDISKEEKLRFVLNDIKVEKDKYSPYKLVTLVFSTKLL